MVRTVAIQNPRVLEIVARERRFGAGRSMTEVAENLILAEAERRGAERAAAEPNSTARSDRKQLAEASSPAGA